MPRLSNFEFGNKIRNGDPESFATLYKETYPRMLGYCKLFITDLKHCEDLIQDCYEKIWLQKAKIDPSKSIESLLFVILRNKCLNFLKKEQQHHNISLSNDFSINELQYLYQLDFTEKKGISIEEELMLSLKKAISKLPDKRKNIFIQCMINGRKQKEVANELGITVKAVEKQLSQAKIQLRKQLQPKYLQLTIILGIFLN